MNTDRTSHFLASRRTLTALVIMLLFALGSYIGYRAIAEYRNTRIALQELSQAAHMIRYCDEVLTMSARMAAFTGDSAWRKRYDEYVPQLDAAIVTTVRLFPAARMAVDQTSAANQRLIALETQAFDYVAAGDLPKARQVLASEAYERDKNTYFAGLTRLNDDILQYRDDVEARLERNLARMQMAAFVLLALVMSALIYGLRLVAKRLELESAVGSIGHALMAPRQGTLDERVVDILQKIADKAGASYCYLMRREFGGTTAAGHGWRLLHAAPAFELDQAAISEHLAALLGAPSADGTVAETVAAMRSRTDQARRSVLTRMGITHLLGTYVGRAADHEYYFGLASRHGMAWDADELPVVRTVADLITSAIDVHDKEVSLQRLATVDMLTGLANRRHFTELLGHEIQRLRRNRQSAALLMIDLDHFKQINDNHGHAAGDTVLQHFAALATDLLREVDVIGRIGGEEFAVLLPDTAADAASQVAERLRAKMAAHPVAIDGSPLQVTASIGVAMLTADAHDMDAAFTQADLALYAAKRAGRNQVRMAPGLAKR